MIECDIAHRRSVTLLCMLCKIRHNPIHSLYGDLPVPYVSVQITQNQLVTRRCSDAPPRSEPCSTQGLLFLCQYSLWNDLGDPVFDCVGMGGFNIRANAVLFILASICFYRSLKFPICGSSSSILVKNIRCGTFQVASVSCRPKVE